MNAQEKVFSCYNQVADQYAAERWDELYKKHLDRLLLTEFASANKDKGLCADLGCGPGQTTRFLYDRGLTGIMGIDLSPGMVSTARRRSPHIPFDTGDLLNLHYPPGHFGSAVAFYAIVHFTTDQIKKCFAEINRVLKPGADFLFSFHAGDAVVNFDKAHDKDVDVDMFFFKTDDITALLAEAGFAIIDAIERQPYAGVEYLSRRGYILACKK